MDQQEDKLFNSTDAAEYLDIPYGIFEAFVYNGYICYIMRDLAQLFKQSELDRFKAEFSRRCYARK